MTEHTTLSSTLTEDLIHEMTKALALPQTRTVRKIIAALTGRAVRRFSELATQLDCVVGREGLAGGVISKTAMYHPITWLRKARPDRQRLAFMYQLIRQMIAGKEIFGLTSRVTFGDLDSAENTRDREHILQTIVRSAHQVLKTHLA